MFAVYIAHTYLINSLENHQDFLNQLALRKHMYLYIFSL